MSKIDTNTTAGKIAVMQAFEDRLAVEFDDHDGKGWLVLDYPSKPAWQWGNCWYRIKPQTAEEAAKRQGRIFKNDAERNEFQRGFVTGAKWQKEQVDE